MMTTTLSYYKKIYRCINRLPIDLKSLKVAKDKVKNAFKTKHSSNSALADPKQYKDSIRLMTSLLNGDYKSFPETLDLIYKKGEPFDDWARDFLHTKYSSFKSSWPQVHLLEEFGMKYHIDHYNKELQELKPEDMEFLLMKEMKLSLLLHEKPIQPLRHHHHKSSVQSLVKEAEKFYKFILANSNALLNGRSKPFEVIYEPTRFGLPKSAAAREHDLRTKVTHVKNIIRQLRPLSREQLTHLAEVASGKIEEERVRINPSFFRYASRQHNAINDVSPFERIYLRQKQLVPNERNIRYFYRDYVTKQFYKDEDGTLKMGPMRFYD